METKDGTATFKEEEAVNYFSNQKNSLTKKITKLITKTNCFINSITVWAAHYNSKTIETIINQKDLFYVSSLVNINTEHPRLPRISLK